MASPGTTQSYDVDDPSVTAALALDHMCGIKNAWPWIYVPNGLRKFQLQMPVKGTPQFNLIEEALKKIRDGCDPGGNITVLWDISLKRAVKVQLADVWAAMLRHAEATLLDDDD